MALLALALAAALQAGAPEPAAGSAAELLSRIRATYTKSPSVNATFVETYAPAGFAAASPETGHVTIQAPDQVRFDYDGSEGKVFTFDGTAARQDVAADGQLVVRRLPPGERARLPIVFLETPESLLGRFAGTVKPALAGVDELDLTPKEEGLPALELLVTSSGEVKRLVVRDGAGNRTTFTFTQTAPGKKRPASDFALVPPAGTKILSE